MEIVHINCVYPNGSTGKIIANIVNNCGSYGHNSIVLYGRGAKIDDGNAIKVSSEIEAKVHGVISRLTGQWFSYSPVSTAHIINILKERRPDVVHLHCLNANFVNVYKLVEYLKKNKIKTILTLHAEIMHTAGCEHAGECTKWMSSCHDCSVINGKLTRYFRDDAKIAYNRMRRAFENFENLTVVGVSEWLTQRAAKSSIFGNKNIRFATVHNAVDTLKFNQPALKKQNKAPVILHITPNFNHPLKGGKYVLELAKRHPEWNFVIVGHSGNDVPQLSNVRFIPHTNNQQELINYYQQSDITLLTSYRETFSMVCLESLACGTPVVGFKAGAPETIFRGNFAEFVEYADVNALGCAVQKFLITKPTVNPEYIEQNFSVDHMVREYVKLYES